MVQLDAPVDRVDILSMQFNDALALTITLREKRDAIQLQTTIQRERLRRVDGLETMKAKQVKALDKLQKLLDRASVLLEKCNPIITETKAVDELMKTLEVSVNGTSNGA